MRFRSIARAMTAASFASAMLIACNAAQTKAVAAAQGGSLEVDASEGPARGVADLNAAIRSARAGDTILLSSGDYGALGLQGLKFSGGQVVIASRDPSRPARVAGIEIADSSNLTFRDIEVTVNARTQTIFNVNDSQDIRLERLHLHGPPGSNRAGLMFRQSGRVHVLDSNFQNVGTAVRVIDSNYVNVSGNHFAEIYGDGIQSTGSSNVMIVGNHLSNFHTAPGDHPDAIQFFTLNQKAEAHDIAIKDNIIIRGSGNIAQGIFLGNEVNLAYVDVTIAGNKVIGAMWNGIAVGGGRNITVNDNVVQAYVDQGSWIIVEKSLNAMVLNNRSTDLIDKDNRNAKFKDNIRLRPTTIGDLSALDAQSAKTD